MSTICSMVISRFYLKAGSPASAGQTVGGGLSKPWLGGL
jgi:hypothetical protein